MTVSPSTKKAIASSVLLGLAGLVVLLSSSTQTNFMPSFRNLQGEDVRGLSGFKPTGFYTSDIGFFTVKPWGPATWSVDFTTKSIKKLNSLLYSAEGKENHKGSILCTDELCQGHGKATTAVLVGADPDGATGECLTADFEIGADAFEVCFTCPPGLDATLSPFTGAGSQSTCMTDVVTPIGGDMDCSDIPVINQLGRTACVQYRNPEEPMPNIVQMQLKYTCDDAMAGRL